VHRPVAQVAADDGSIEYRVLPRWRVLVQHLQGSAVHVQRVQRECTTHDDMTATGDGHVTVAACRAAKKYAGCVERTAGNHRVTGSLSAGQGAVIADPKDID